MPFQLCSCLLPEGLVRGLQSRPCHAGGACSHQDAAPPRPPAIHVTHRCQPQQLLHSRPARRDHTAVARPAVVILARRLGRQLAGGGERAGRGMAAGFTSQRQAFNPSLAPSIFRLHVRPVALA